MDWIRQTTYPSPARPMALPVARSSHTFLFSAWPMPKPAACSAAVAIMKPAAKLERTVRAQFVSRAPRRETAKTRPPSAPQTPSARVWPKRRPSPAPTPKRQCPLDHRHFTAVGTNTKPSAITPTKLAGISQRALPLNEAAHKPTAAWQGYGRGRSRGGDAGQKATVGMAGVREGGGGNGEKEEQGEQFVHEDSFRLRVNGAAFRRPLSGIRLRLLQKISFALRRQEPKANATLCLS